MPVALAFASSILWAIAVACATWTIFSVITSARYQGTAEEAFEVERRAKLRSRKPLYYWFEPLIDEMSVWNRTLRDRGSLAVIKQQMVQAGDELPWHAQEYYSSLQLEAVAGAFAVGLILALLSVPLGILAGMAVLFVYPVLEARSLKERAVKRQRSLKRRLPFAVDLMALMLEAGGTFAEALRTVVNENQGHPLGDEFKKVIDKIDMGRPQSEALHAFQATVDDQDVSELVLAIVNGEELGTPLSVVLRNQAEQMRLKRSQWGEKAAAEAQVAIVFPGLLVMLACILVILAPLALPAIFGRPPGS